MTTTHYMPHLNGKKLRPIDSHAVELCNLTLNRLKSNPLVKIVPQVDLSRHVVSVPNEHGRLKKVVVSPPPYLDWDCSCPINEKEKANSEQGIMPDRYLATMEWGTFVHKLVKQGVEVTIIEPQQHLLEAVYTRDPAFAIDDKLFIGSMQADVRKPETGLYANGGISPPAGHNIIMEGGNVMLGQDCVFVGVGDRTTLEGVLWLQEMLGTSREVIPLKLKKGILHLDCVFKPHDGSTNDRHLIIDRKAFENDGKFCDADMRGLKYEGAPHPRIFKGLPPAVKRYKKHIVIHPSERNSLMPNMVMVHPKLAIVNYLSERIKSALGRVIDVVVVPSTQVAIGDGSHRCTTMPLMREKD